MKVIYTDGGRAAAGFKGRSNDCVVRSVALATGLPYAEVYARLNDGMRTQRAGKRAGKSSGLAAKGVTCRRKWFKDYMRAIGWDWVPTMSIGSGCTVHLHDGELPMGRLIVSLSKHYTCVIDGVIFDTNDPQRDVHCHEHYRGQELKAGQWVNPGNNLVCSIQRRCVYGYWRQRA